jgi:SAM-dependent methyltransferase
MKNITVNKNRKSSELQSFLAEKKIWEQLGTEDPLWAVVSSKIYQGGKWDRNKFFATGEEDVARYHEILRKNLGCAERLGRLLDFGCGVGRLTLAWSRRADEVVGVDVSAPMIEHAKSTLQNVPNAQVLLNDSTNLSQFDNDSFDVVASHICLQHIPPQATSYYIVEFGRICCPGGAVIFQLPSRFRSLQVFSKIRSWIVENAPFGLGPLYRRLKGGSSVRFKVHCIRSEVVVALAATADLELVGVEDDYSAGNSIVSHIYVFRKKLTLSNL